jgi:alanine racemase
MQEINSYSLKLLAGILGLNLGLRNPERIIRNLLTDSRRLNNPGHTLFFCLNGKKNSLDFIPELYALGVRAFVIPSGSQNSGQSALSLDIFPEADFLPVIDTLIALQKIGAFHRQLFHYPVIAITGSNGKTIVKEWLYQLLSPEQHIIRSPKSYNSQIGVPLSVWGMSSDYTMALFEAGISESGEMRALEEIIQPSIGILTNLGTAHDEGFSSMEEKEREKISLFQNSDSLIYSPDYFTIKKGEIKAKEIFTWSLRTSADLEITETRVLLYNTQIFALYRGKKIHIEIPFTDRASIENAIICWAVLLYMHYSQEIILERMTKLYSLGMRLELKPGIQNCSIINDSYSLDLPSLEIALDFLNQQSQDQKKTIILSDILQTGMDLGTLYYQLAGLVQSKGVHRLLGIGTEITLYQDLFSMEKEFYSSTQEFIKRFDPKNFYNEAILIKGARIFEFENITRLFEKKVHETVLEINLNAIIHNYNYYRRKLEPKTKVMVMVKAFSYGIGSSEVASILQYHRVDYLAVAYVDEGISLRNAGITLPILVLNPDISGFPALLRYNLEAEIYSFRILKAFSEFVQSQGKGSHPVHIKMDTGMHRLGFNPEEVDELIQVLIKNPQVEVKGIFSHLASSENPKDDDFTRKQIAVFQSLAETVRKGLGYPMIRHISNTAALSRFPESQMDMVRLGIGLYGIGLPEERNSIQTVGILKSSISQIRKVKAGETVGYNRQGILNRDSLIATVKIGYADGYRREFGNGLGKMLVRDRLAPVVGKVCMDMTMIDITDSGGEETEEVIIFNDQIRVENLAKDIGTISYELLSGISSRVKRVYYYE